MSAEITLRNGMVALLDEEDILLVQQHEWQAVKIYNMYYATTQIDGHTAYMHRIITGAPDGMDVDHDNRNGLDNRRLNLIVRGRSGNIANAGMFKHNTTGYKGVIKYRNGWRAQTKFLHNGIQRVIASATYENIEYAARIGDAMMVILHGENVYLNFDGNIPSSDEMLEAQRLIDRTLSHGPVAVNKYDAFGESKTILEWECDPRCVVSKERVRDRIYRLGWSFEKAISTKKVYEPHASATRQPAPAYCA